MTHNRADKSLVIEKETIIKMGDIINLDSTRDPQILAVMNDPVLYPALDEADGRVTSYTALPVSSLTTLGPAFQPLATAAQKATSGAGGSGLYYVNTSGKTMFKMKGTDAYIGSLQNGAGKVGGGQAQLTPFACDPAMIFMAAALANIDQKLDAIKEMQQEIMNFLVQKDKSELRANLSFLYEVFSNYKYNWDNDLYKSSNHAQVLSIKRDSEAKIVFYREQINAKINRKTFIHVDQNVNKQLQAVQDQFKDYQLALYALAFSTFIDVMLIENYSEDYLTEVKARLEEHAVKYKELYTRCYNEISEYSETSVQSSLLKGASKITLAAGKLVERMPVISATQVDETLIAAGDRLKLAGSEKTRKQMTLLIERQSNSVRPFIDNIETLNRLNNKPVRVLLDNENIYIATA
jgi:hypothetical protein